METRLSISKGHIMRIYFKNPATLLAIFIFGGLVGSAITGEYFYHNMQDLSCHISFSDGMRSKHVIIGKTVEVNDE